MPQKRAVAGTIRGGRQVGGEYLPNKTADLVPLRDGLGVMDIVIGSDESSDVEWAETSARIGGRTIKWHRHDDGTVTCSNEDNLTFFMLEGLNNETYWDEIPPYIDGIEPKWRQNKHDVAVWGGEIVGALLEEGYIDPVPREKEVSGPQNCLTACHRATNLPFTQLGRHRLSAALARSRAVTFVHKMGSTFQYTTLGGCAIKKLDNAFGNRTDIYFAEANLRDCYTEWDIHKHQTKSYNNTYNGKTNDLIWKVLLAKVPHDNDYHDDGKNEESALLCALRSQRNNHRIGTGNNAVVLPSQHITTLIADGCIESDEVAAEVLQWLDADNKARSQFRPHGRAEFVAHLWELLAFPKITSNKDPYYQGEHRRRLIQIFSAGFLNPNINYFARLVIPGIYRDATDVFRFRNWIHDVDQWTGLLEEAERNGWGNDKYTAKAIECNKATLQKVYDNVHPELHQWIPNAGQYTREELKAQHEHSRLN